MPENKNHVQLQRSLGLYSALSLVIGTIIGSGIFFKQSSILANAQKLKHLRLRMHRNYLNH